MKYKNEILDDELATPEKKGKELIWLWALFATLVAAALYMIPLFIIYPNFGEKASPQNEFLSGLLSFLHLFMAMGMMNSFVNKNRKKLLRGGYYVLFFGSGVFFIGAILDIFNSLVMVEEHNGLSFWGENYEAIIIIIIVFLKLLLIRPLVYFLTKK